MMMTMMVNCFCGMADRRKAFSLISSREHCQRSSPSRILNTPRAGWKYTCRNIHWFYQHYQSGKVIFQVAVLMTENLLLSLINYGQRNMCQICGFPGHYTVQYGGGLKKSSQRFFCIIVFKSHFSMVIIQNKKKILVSNRQFRHTQTIKS